MTTDLFCTVMAANSGTLHSLVSALIDKYDYKADNFCEIYIPKSAPGKTDTGEIRVPSQLVLHEYSIETAGDPEQIAALCRDVTELDISHNCLRDWSEVFTILKQVPKVNFLNLAHNPLGQAPAPSGERGPFSSICKLVLNKTEVSWSTVRYLLSVMPELQEFHISINSYSSVDQIHQSPHSNIKTLHFNTNHVTRWEEICKLGLAFPNLKHLVMVENNIDSFEPSNQIAESFPHVTSLNISQTSVARWVELVKLNLFPSLVDIRMQGIPLLENMDKEQRRKFVIAYLPSIQRLNGSTVREQERNDAERAFIRFYMDREDQPDRYQELVNKYGKLDPLANVDLTPKDHAKVTVTVDDTDIEEVLFVNTTQTIADLKKGLQNVAKLPPNKFRLFFEDIGSLQGLEELRLTQRKLYNLPVKDGDRFLIVPK